MPARRPSLLGATAVAATAALGLSGAAYAQDTDQPKQSESARPGPGRPGRHLDAAAEALDLSVEELRERLADGKTLAQVSQDQGVDVQVVIDALIADATEHLDQAVADGKLSAEEANQRKANLTERITEGVNEGFRPPGRGGPGGPGPSLEKAATALGLTVDDLHAQLRDGKTLAQVAQDRGVDAQTVIDALVADASARIDQAVADGRITAEAAEERKANLTERITNLVNNGPPARGEHVPGEHGPDGPPPGGERQREGASASTQSS